MTNDPALDVFEAEQPRLFGLAYRMLGTIADADDIVQETWLRWNEASDIERPAAWLTTVASRLAVDRLRSAQRRRETYVGPWLPEPILTDREDPAHLVELNESLTLGFMTVLDRLEPMDRAVFLLREVFDTPYDEIAAAVGRNEAACRQIARRARERVVRERPAVVMQAQRRGELLEAFLAALFSGDAAMLEPLLVEDVVHLGDGGAAQRAARYPVVGRKRVARLLTNLGQRGLELGVAIEQVEANGQPALLVTLDDVAITVMEIEFDGALVRRVHAVLNPEKLANTLGA